MSEVSKRIQDAYDLLEEKLIIKIHIRDSKTEEVSESVSNT